MQFLCLVAVLGVERRSASTTVNSKAALNAALFYV